MVPKHFGKIQHYSQTLL